MLDQTAYRSDRQAGRRTSRPDVLTGVACTAREALATTGFPGTLTIRTRRWFVWVAVRYHNCTYCPSSTTGDGKALSSAGSITADL